MTEIPKRIFPLEAKSGNGSEMGIGKMCMSVHFAEAQRTVVAAVRASTYTFFAPRPIASWPMSHRSHCALVIGGYKGSRRDGTAEHITGTASQHSYRVEPA